MVKKFDFTWGLAPIPLYFGEKPRLKHSDPSAVSVRTWTFLAHRFEGGARNGFAHENHGTHYGNLRYNNERKYLRLENFLQVF